MQACPQLRAFTGTPMQRRQQLVQHLVLRAKHKAGLTNEEPQSLGRAADGLTCPDESSKFRAALLTPLLSGVLKDFGSWVLKEFGYQPDSLVTDVIRAVKAWSKFGLPGVLLQSGSAGPGGAAVGAASPSSGTAAAAGTGAGAGAAAGPSLAARTVLAGLQPSSSTEAGYDHTKLPPGFVWEIFVMYVLQQRLQQAKAAGTAAQEVYPSGRRQLQLFIDVLEAASKLLQHTSTEPIMLPPPCSYGSCSPQECQQLFQKLWGPVGQLFTPFIISPVDPSYNCTINTPFKGWGKVADAAGQLHMQIQHALKQAGGGQDGAGSSAGSAAGEAWQWLLSNSSLGAAVNAFSLPQSCGA